MSSCSRLQLVYFCLHRLRVNTEGLVNHQLLSPRTQRILSVLLDSIDESLPLDMTLLLGLIPLLVLQDPVYQARMRELES